ncbi:MAG: ATP-binding protein, partial [Armatimonadota bacterium]
IEAAHDTLAARPRIMKPTSDGRRPAVSAGTVTFLLTDIEGARALVERLGDSFEPVLEKHSELLRREFRRHDAEEISRAGDGFTVVLPTARDAVACAVACQEAMASARWPAAVSPLRVRMALYTGDVAPGQNERHDDVLHRASRVLIAGHGGQILCSEATAALLRRHLDLDVALRDLGTYRLRDVPAPEKLFQVDYPAMPQTRFPALRAEVGYPSNLPLQLTRFFGRGTELAQLGELLAAADVRLVTLSGPAGSGKTRLALKAAEQALERFEGAVWFIPLAEVRDAALIPTVIADRLELQRSPSLDPLEQIVTFLSGRTPLLVLDNLEQLAGDAGSVIYSLLDRLPSLTCLATSRQRLDVPGEREFVVSPLPTPGESCTLEELIRCESAQLFMDRAQEARPDFQVTDANAQAVATLCARLEGLPLAIELAAARAQVLSPGQMLARLDHRFEFLVSSRHIMHERHSTLRAAMDWSYELLSPELQRLLCALSVFEGGWLLEAAEEVCGEPDALGLLQELLDSSLVVASTSNSSIRFSMLDTVRDYARQRVDEDQWEHLCERHGEHFLKLCGEAACSLNGEQQAQWVDRLEPERDNLRAALSWAQVAYGAERYARIALRVCPVLYHCGHWAELRASLEAALAELESSRARGVGAVRSSLEYELGGLALDMGELDRAGELARCALRRRRGLGDRAGSAEVLNLLGLVHLNRGEDAAARKCFEDVLRLWPDAHGRARALHNLARLTAGPGDAAEAERLYREALRCRREAHDVRGEAETLNSLGAMAHGAGDVPAAREYYLRSLSIYQALRYPHGIGVALNNLAELAEMDDDLAAGVCLYSHAARLLRSVGSRHAKVPAQALARLQRRCEAAQWSELSAQAEGTPWEAVLGDVEQTQA